VPSVLSAVVIFFLLRPWGWAASTVGNTSLFRAAAVRLRGWEVVDGVVAVCVVAVVVGVVVVLTVAVFGGATTFAPR